MYRSYPSGTMLLVSRGETSPISQTSPGFSRRTRSKKTGDDAPQATHRLVDVAVVHVDQTNPQGHQMRNRAHRVPPVTFRASELATDMDCIVRITSPPTPGTRRFYPTRSQRCQPLFFSCYSSIFPARAPRSHLLHGANPFFSRREKSLRQLTQHRMTRR